MARLAACPKCRNQFSLPELTGPATIACPFCGAHITIKVKGTGAPPPAMVVQPAKAIARAMPVDDEDDEVNEEETRTKKKKKKGKKLTSAASNETSMKIAIVVGIFLLTIVSIAFALWWFVSDYKSKPNQILPTEVQQGSKLRTDNTPVPKSETGKAIVSEEYEQADKPLSNS